jgi:AraC-like DNA-binding protein
MIGRTISAAWVKGVADMMSAQGLNTRSLFAQAGMDIAVLQDPAARIPADSFSQVWDLAVAQSGNLHLGLDRLLAARYGYLDVVGHALASAPCLRAGFERLARQMAVVSDAATFALQEEGTQGFWLILGHIGTARPVPRQRVEYGMLTLLMLCQWLTRQKVEPLVVELVYPAPANPSPLRVAFGVPMLFDQPASRMLLTRQDLLSPIPTHNSSLWELHGRLVEERLDELGQTHISTRVRSELARVLHQGEPRRDAIAARLHLSDRTLQRRLLAEASSFAQLLDETRCELARQYLSDTHRGLGEVADLLGFADQSNLFRACRRWFGMPPGQYRAQLTAHGHSSHPPE